MARGGEGTSGQALHGVRKLGVLAVLLVSGPAVAFTEGAPALACFEQVREGALLDEQSALRLCSGALSDAPAACYKLAREKTFLTSTGALQLCQCAPSTAPVDCYIQADQQTFLEDYQILQLCSPILNGYPVGCAVYVYPPSGYPLAPLPYWRP